MVSYPIEKLLYNSNGIHKKYIDKIVSVIFKTFLYDMVFLYYDDSDGEFLEKDDDEIICNITSNDVDYYGNILHRWEAYSNKYLKYVVFNDNGEIIETNDESIIHITSRTVNPGMRYKVMKRDNHKCVKCGRSPATNDKVELEIDHVIPWSKGGETIIENLQTLCSICNTGKSNLH